MTSTRAAVDVAVGILIRPDGTLLLASRPEGKPYAGYWEFPGGKLEPGETVAHALRRELHEELGIDIGPVCPWLVRVHDYPHALVRLHFCRVFRWNGELHARERQRFGFYPLDGLPAPLLPATIPVLRGLALPPVYAITAAGRLGVDAFLARLRSACDNGLQLVQLREPGLGGEAVRELFNAVREITRRAGSRLLVSSRHPRDLWEQADGVHLTAEALSTASERPGVPWVGASVHDAEELRKAGELGLDFAVLGPVQRTPTHPDQEPLGWPAFGRLAKDATIPVYAIGGLSAEDLDGSRLHGSHGVALLSAAWRPGQCFDSGGSVGGVSSASSAGPPGTT
jgi:8-oxo-dGTP diphosphatase